jgi:hypothetical protein
VAGFKPGLSAVVLTLDEATNTVFGSVRFSDNSTRGFKVFTVCTTVLHRVPVCCCLFTSSLRATNVSYHNSGATVWPHVLYQQQQQQQQQLLLIEQLLQHMFLT